MTNSLLIVFRFLVHVIVACTLFVGVGLGATAIWEFSKWLLAIGSPYEIWMAFHFIADIVFGVDVICAVFFIFVEGMKFLKQIWANRGA